MTLLFLVAAVVIFAVIIIKLKKSKSEDLEKNLDIVTAVEPEVAQVNEVLEQPVIKPVVEEAPKKVIESKPKSAKKTTAKAEVKEKNKEVKSKKTKK